VCIKALHSTNYSTLLALASLSLIRKSLGKGDRRRQIFKILEAIVFLAVSVNIV
jgi:hypothetical protein